MTDNVQQIHDRGVELIQQGDLDGAKLHFQAVLLANPVYYPALANMAVILSDQNHLLAAKTLYTKIVKLVEQDANQWSNFGNILFRLGEYDEAERALKRAIELAPDNVNGWYNFSLLYHYSGRQREAQAALDQVEALGLSTSRVREDRAHFFLAQGDLPTALEHYEERWNSLLHQEPWDFHLKEWTGESLTDKTILIHHEQGFGDTIMTARFVSDFAQKYDCRVVFAVPAALVELFESQDWPGVEVVAIEGLDNPQVDYHSPLWSMVRWRGIQKSDITGEKYLTAPKIVTPSTIDSRMINIGICWASGKRNSPMDVRRRISPLKDWLCLSEHPMVQLHNLWKDGDAQVEIDSLGAGPIVRNDVDNLHSFAQTGAYLKKFDLVIGVDTAIIHLAGALGIQTYMVSHLANCWRWWDIKAGLGTPWYDSVAIVHQRDQSNWTEPLLEVRNKVFPWIDALVESRQARAAA